MKKLVAIAAVLFSVVSSGVSREDGVDVAVDEVEADYECPPGADLLKLFEEEVLSGSAASGREVYRFTYIPTFSKPYLVRFEAHDENTGTLWCKRLSGKGGYEIGRLEMSNMRTSSPVWMEAIGIWKPDPAKGMDVFTCGVQKVLRK